MNPEQLKIIGVMVGTLVLAIIIDSMGSGTSGSRKAASSWESASGPSTKPTKKSSTVSTKPSCTKKGIKLYGDVQFVDSFPDLTIKYVSSFPDINVQFVSSFPSNCGQWKVVESFPDFTVQVVSSFPDLEVKKVSSFPGME